MKKVYERPVMMAEAYETNAYCNGCGVVFKDGKLVLDETCTYKDGDGGTWVGTSTIGKTELYHTFQGNAFTKSTGICNSFRKCDDISQSIWKCTCHPNNPYYLEWSHHYSKHVYPYHDTYFLYREEENSATSGFDIIARLDKCPQQGNTTTPPGGLSDYNLAQVVYKESTSTVVNS